MATSPEIAKDLAWAGIDMVGNANNHTYDYGSIGVLEENLQNLAKAHVLVAGAGEEYRRMLPKYFHHSRGTVALIPAASSFVHYGKASRSRPDLHGRPGLNPLAIHSHIAVDIPSGAADFLGLVARLVGVSGRPFDRDRFHLLGVEVTRGRPFHLYTGTRPSPIDLKANLETIIQASRSADVVNCCHSCAHARRLVACLCSSSNRCRCRYFPGARPTRNRSNRDLQRSPYLLLPWRFLLRAAPHRASPSRILRAVWAR